MYKNSIFNKDNQNTSTEEDDENISSKHLNAQRNSKLEMSGNSNEESPESPNPKDDEMSLTISPF